MFLPDAELTAIRADVERMLPNTGNILSVTLASDGAGGMVETWGTATANVPYRLDAPYRGHESVAGAALQPFHVFVLTLPHDVTITTENRFQGEDGKLYNVASLNDGQSWKASTRAYVEAI